MTTANVQAVWFDATVWARDAAIDWAENHNFKTDNVRTRQDRNDLVTHWIAVQFEPEDGVEYRTVANDFPDGVSATCVIEEDKDMTVTYKNAEQSKDDPFTFIMSTGDVDRDGDTIDPKGIDMRSFRKNPVALWQHDPSQPIGVWKNMRVEGGKLLGDLKLAAEGTSDLIDTLHSLIVQRVLRAVSIGFQPKDYDRREGGGLAFTAVELLECSLVSVPANQNALRVKAATIIPDSLQEEILGRSPRARSKSAPKGSAINPNPSEKGKRPMNIADRIKAKQDRLVAVKDRLTEIKSLLEADDDYELSDDEQAELETLDDEQETLIKSIDSLKSIEDGLAKRAKPAAKTTPSGRTPAKAEVKERGGSLLIKTMAVHLVAHMTQQTVGDTIDMMYSDDDRVKAVSKVYGNKRRMSKSAVDAADTTTTGWAAELVQNDLRGFLAEMAPMSVYAGLLALPNAQSLEFGGAGSVTIPRRNKTNQSSGAAAVMAAHSGLGSQIGGSWVGEGGVIPVKQLALGSQTLNRFKLAVISAMTGEILEQSTPNIENIVRSAILEDTSLSVDGALLDGAAGVAGVRPASIFAGAATQASAGATAQDVIDDIKWLLGQMSAINGSYPVLILNKNRLLGLSTITTAAGGFLFRDEIAQGLLLGVPFVTSTNVNPTAVGVVDAASFVGANDTPAFMVSDQATLTMANADGTAPSQAGDATDHTGGDLGTAEQVPPDGGIVVGGDTTGAPAGSSVTGYHAQSMFQQYQTAVRMIMPSSWGLIRAGSSAYVTGVNW